MQTKTNKQAFNTESIGMSSMIVHYFGHEDCEPLHFWGPMSRDHYLIHYIMDGRGVFETNNTEYFLKKGDIFLARPGEKVFYQADETEPYSYRWVGFNGNEISYLLSHTSFKKGINVISLEPEYRDEFLETLEHMHENQGIEIHQMLTICSDFLRLFSILSKQASKNDNNEQGYENLLIKATDFINVNISNPNISVDQLARHVGLSQSSLYRLFIKNTGISPVKYISHTRMSRACELMRTTRMTIKEISYSVGFSNSLYFSKFFRKCFDMSPTEFINTYVNKKHPLELDLFRPFVP